MPVSGTDSSASSGEPPLQPWAEPPPLQSSSCCALRSASWPPDWRAARVSSAAVAEKAQLPLHCVF